MGATSFVNVTSVSRSTSAAFAGTATSPAAASAAPTNSNLTGPEMIASLATASGLSRHRGATAATASQF